MCERPGIRGGFQRREEEGWGKAKECQTVIDVRKLTLTETRLFELSVMSYKNLG